MRRLAGLGLLLLACGGRSAERDGDRAWARGDWDQALTSYRDAGDAPRLLQKQADAAWQSGALDQVVPPLVLLADRDPTLRYEAATGLARVVQRATRTHDQQALLLAANALRQVDPEWPMIRLLRPAIEAGILTDGDTPGGLQWLLLAAAPDADRGASALRGLARQEVAQEGCAQALPLFRSTAARLDGAERAAVQREAAGCALTLGLTALEAMQDREAERWFDQVLLWDPDGAAGRRALVGIGDARLAQGDLASAVLAWRTVVAAAGPSDTTVLLAVERLQATAIAPPDSILSVSGRL